MTGRKRPVSTPYPYELLIAANMAAIWVVASRDAFAFGRTMVSTFLSSVPFFGVYIVVGIGARCLVQSRKPGGARAYLDAIRNAGFATDVGRMTLFGLLMVHTYGWIKLLVPVLHPRLYDQELWDLDRALFFGLSPNVLFLDLFSHPLVLRVIDKTYAMVFLTTMVLTFSFFLSEPSRRLRTAFMTGNTLLWLSGAWLYLAVPSLGPAFRFPDLWMPLGELLGTTQHFQAILMRNYQNVLHLNENPRLQVSLLYGIAAFPSLHVAFQVFVFLWMRRLWRSGEVLVGVFAFVILLGSVVTGWHYLIDGIAGVVLAAVCYAAAAKGYRIGRAIHLRTRLQSGRPDR